MRTKWLAVLASIALAGSAAVDRAGAQVTEDVPVVTIRFLPTVDGVYLDRTRAPDYWDIDPITLAEKNAQLDLTTQRIKFALTEGSRFRGYHDPQAAPALNYRIVDELVFYDVPPASSVFFSPWDQHFPALDYYAILNMINAEHYVNDLGVKEFWVYYNTCDPSFPSWQLQPGAYDPANSRWLVETNMASPTAGDISNSIRTSNDLPIYSKTYVVFEYGLVSDMADFVHEHGHQLEAMFSYAAIQQDGSDRLFWNDFAGRISEPGQPFVMGTGRCGSTHYPPNTTVDYDYSNPNYVNSDIEDWRPDHSGQQMPVNKDTWLGIPYAWPQLGTLPFKFPDAQWYVFWMQAMPGCGNTIPKDSGEMTNWWRFISRWDEMVTANAGLYTNPTAFGAGNFSAQGTQGQLFSYQLTAAIPSPYYAAVGLPAGLTINETTGLITGTPIPAGVFPVLVTATNSATTASTKLSLTVAPNTQLTSAASRATHGSAGDFDVDLPLVGEPGMECRSTGGNHTLIFTFNNDVVAGGASVTSGVASIAGDPTFAGKTMMVNLTGVSDAQMVTVTLSNVRDSFGQTLPDKTVNVNILIGDTTGNGTVNASDVSQTKSKSGQAVDATNFRSDVTVNGSINAGDVSLVKLASGTALP